MLGTAPLAVGTAGAGAANSPNSTPHDLRTEGAWPEAWALTPPLLVRGTERGSVLHEARPLDEK